MRSIAVVSGAGNVGYACHVVVVFAKRAIRPHDASVAVADDTRAERDGLNLGSLQVGSAAAIRFDQVDGAVRAARRNHVEVEGLLEAPFQISDRVIADLTLLIIFCEGRGRQAEIGAVEP